MTPFPWKMGFCLMDQRLAHIFTKNYVVGTYMDLSCGGKIDLIINVFVNEESFRFPETIRSFTYEWLLLFP